MKEENEYTWEIQGRGVKLGKGLYEQMNTSNKYKYTSFTKEDVEKIIKEMYYDRKAFENAKPVKKIKRKKLSI